MELTLNETVCTNCLFNEANAEIESTGLYEFGMNRKSKQVLLVPCYLSARGLVVAKKYKSSCKLFEPVCRDRMRIPFELSPEQRSRRFNIK